jgi:hypothetical protein
MFDNEAQRALQMTSLASKLKIKDTILKECLHICNQNFDKRNYYSCVQCSEDDWMVWNYTMILPKSTTILQRWSQNFSMYFMSALKVFLVFHFSGVIACFMKGETL